MVLLFQKCLVLRLGCVCAFVCMSACDQISWQTQQQGALGQGLGKGRNPKAPVSRDQTRPVSSPWGRGVPTFVAATGSTPGNDSFPGGLPGCMQKTWGSGRSHSWKASAEGAGRIGPRAGTGWLPQGRGGLCPWPRLTEGRHRRLNL